MVTTASTTLAGWNLYGKGIDEVLMRADYVAVPGGQGYFYQQNHLGSVTHLTGWAGETIEKYSYDAYGAPTTTYTGGVFNNRFKFTGREYASSFGVYEYRNRAYHPGLGRFVSEDPTGFAGGDYNLFRYCGNDPVNQSDPMGLESAPVPIARLNLTSSGKGDWVFDQRNISYWDEMQHRQPAGNIMIALEKKGEAEAKGLNVNYINYPEKGSGGRPVVDRALRELKRTSRGRFFFSRHDTITVLPTDSTHRTGFGRGSKTGKPYLYLNPADSRFYDADTYRSMMRHRGELPPDSDKGRAAVIAHEFGHLIGAKDEDEPGGRNVRDNENPVRDELGIPLRRAYHGVQFPINE